MTNNLIEFKNVSKQFPDKSAVANFNLSIADGELFVLVGPSGSGKTTTLKMINGLERPTGGSIVFDGKELVSYNIRQLRWQIGYVLQQIALFPNLTVAQNISLISEIQHRIKTKEAKKTLVSDALSSVNLDPAVYAERMPHELSGGEQQRIGILRAFASNPRVVLMDEAFSALDPISRNQLQNLVLKMHEETHTTIVFVTHDMNEALKLGDRIGVMNNGELLQVGTPTEIAQQPANELVSKLFANSGSEDVYQTYLGRIGTLGYYVGQPEDQLTEKLAENDTLGDGLQVLANNKVIEIVLNNETKGFLTSQSIINFLNDHQVDK
ncbi:ABC-type proline/glycine betaine transport systems, ATPase components [Secundilactobacillus oryzae JCM 18671]|uniref:ABC-type quaternary amine transporter n=1 Tax=Secundilactobacillus oryzae JCM 18671 TaxID=1291743 RepID=A0A081BID8_9LACO|nr:ABC transporter ATP-binding protein [Secundilactobacillus oryzae]GAK47806.1 ABC-type proline/glycine betaine transport systems, ATPase components [Secundilactobacillus oryzae JCM 18671]